MENSLTKNLRRLNVAVVSHIFATGPALDLEEFLYPRVKSLLFVGHPFSYRREVNSFNRYYEQGKLAKEHKAIGWRLPEVLMYFKDAFYTLRWVGLAKNRVDLYIGSDNFDAFVGLILKSFGKVDDVVLYTIDYIPQRFESPILNHIYRFFDKQCLKMCKIVWNVSPVMASAREQYGGIKEADNVKQIVVPLGMWYKRIPRLPFSRRERYELIFMGHVLEKQGLDVVVRALPEIIKKFPKVKLIIMGTGEHEDKLKSLVKKLKIESFVRFTGYVEKHEDIERELAKSTISLAMYKPDPNSFTNWADPGKLKNYLAAGCPVVVTNVPPVAHEIEEKRCGVISEYDEKDFANKVIKLLGNTTLLKEYSNNSVKWSKRFDWEIVFTKALRETIG